MNYPVATRITELAEELETSAEIQRQVFYDMAKLLDEFMSNYKQTIQEIKDMQL